MENLYTKINEIGKKVVNKDISMEFSFNRSLAFANNDS